MPNSNSQRKFGSSGGSGGPVRTPNRTELSRTRTPEPEPTKSRFLVSPGRGGEGSEEGSISALSGVPRNIPEAYASQRLGRGRRGGVEVGSPPPGPAAQSPGGRRLQLATAGTLGNRGGEVWEVDRECHLADLLAACSSRPPRRPTEPNEQETELPVRNMSEMLDEVKPR